MGSGCGLGFALRPRHARNVHVPDPEEGASPETQRKCCDTPVAPREDGEKPTLD